MDRRKRFWPAQRHSARRPFDSCGENGIIELDEDLMVNDESLHASNRATWGAVVLLLLLIAACLVVGAINAGPGFAVNGEHVRVRLVSAVTNYPFCPPEIPCPISVILNENHWVVWIIRDRIGIAEDAPYFRKLIDIRLP